MTELRKQFEVLPEINRVLSNSSYSFEDGYYRFNGSAHNAKIVYAMGYVNGAWVVFQEQQKRIDQLKKYLIDSCAFEDEHIEGLLK